MGLRLVGGRIVTADAVLADGSLSIAPDGTIAALNRDAVPGEMDIPLGGRLLLPGFVDLHGDAIEKEVEPRPGAFFPLAVALDSIDRRCAMAGITTAFHGVSFASGEMGVRDPARAKALVENLAAFRPQALVDHRIHSRYEITDPLSAPVLAELLGARQLDLLSFMDHTPGQGQYKDVAVYRGYLAREYRTDAASVEALIQRKIAQAGPAWNRVAELAARARQQKVPVAGHDVEGLERIAFLKALGAGICEFPLDLTTARAAHTEGLATLFGAPNVMRGKSTSGALSAREAIHAGVATGLCSDYAPQSLLPAVGVLTRELEFELPAAVALVSSKPAQAVGLVDRGVIAQDKRADLLVVSTRGPENTLRLDGVWCRGRPVVATSR
ncbi:MAG: alpha-D-ribose 1-methylphosphonate 5-triphosphate diphosphatase [Candidatus Competibacterales bacterium]